MRTMLPVALLVLAAFAFSCARDYNKEVVGKWNAGKATSDKDMLFTLRGDGTFTAEVVGHDMKPAPGSYRIKKGRIYFTFPTIELHYKIVSLDEKTLVMSSKYARLTWRRVE